MAGGTYVVIALTFGIATGVIGRAKGGSFLLWFLIGGIVPLLGLIVVILYRREQDEPERTCPRCGRVLKLYVQVCSHCGTDLYLPDPSEVRRPGGASSTATRP
jgi:ribosomal protein L37E